MTRHDFNARLFAELQAFEQQRRVMVIAISPSDLNEVLNDPFVRPVSLDIALFTAFPEVWSFTFFRSRVMLDPTIPKGAFMFWTRL